MTQDAPPDDLGDPLPSSFWKALNLPEPRRSDDRLAPHVDRDFLLRLARKELPEGLDLAAFLLIHAFDSWKNAYREILVQEFHRNQRSQEDSK